LLSIFRKHAPGFISHFGTFVLLAVLSIANDEPGLIYAMSALVPVWMASSVLWTEREESEEFLRALPLTDRDVARAKFGLLLFAAVVYWLIIFFTSLFHAASGGFLFNLGLMTTGCSVGLVVAGLCYVSVWFFGWKPMTPVIILFLLAGTVNSIMITRAIRTTVAGAVRSMTEPMVGVGVPVYIGMIALAVALTALYGLMELGARVRRLGSLP
jgi:hypothetical protein